MDNIPPHKPRPFRFSLKLAGLCFGASFVAHAAAVLSMVLTPVPEASAWSSSRSATPNSQRHIVEVTVMMGGMDFAPKPAQAPAETSDQPPVEMVPPVPVAVPELGQAGDDLPPSTQATTAKPPTPKEPIALEPQVEPELQPIALDLPKTPLSDAPIPQIAELFKPESNEAPEAIEPVQAPETIAQADLPDVPVAEAPKQLPSPMADVPQEAQASAEQAEPLEQSPTEPAPQTAEASEDSKEEVESPVEKQADATAAEVYDEDSVDQSIAFDKKVRPRLSMISKRLQERGIVRILIEVDAAGTLVNHEVLDDAGFPRLLEAALAALEDSTFEPAMRGDRPVRSTRVIEYRF